jgi:hypothetical protein
MTVAIVNVERQFRCTDGLGGLETLNRDSSVGHFDNGSTNAEQTILVCTRTPQGTTTKYLRRIRRFAPKAAISFVMSVCQFARTRKQTDFCDILY